MNKEFVVVLAAAATATAPAAFAQTSPSAAPTQDASYAVATVQRVCLPILRGGAVKHVAQSAGFRLQAGGWVLPIAGKGEIDLTPPDAVNPHVCTLTMNAPHSDGSAMRAALGAWASAQRPPLAARGVDQNVPGASRAWVISTWSAQTAAGAESVVLTQPQPAAGGNSPSVSQQSTLLVSLSPV